MASGWLVALIFVIVTTKFTTTETSDAFKLDTSDVYPDWLPIKAKQSSAVEEFLKVETKKLTKRLARPNNYVFAVAAPDSDDYYDKGQGDSAGDDYYEKKEWSDVYRDAHPTKHDSVKIDHPDLSDIEGIGVAGHKPHHHQQHHQKEQHKQQKEQQQQQKQQKEQHQEQSEEHEEQPKPPVAATKRDEKEIAKKTKNNEVKEKKAVKTKKSGKKATSKVVRGTKEEDDYPSTRAPRSWPAPVTVGAFELFG